MTRIKAILPSDAQIRSPRKLRKFSRRIFEEDFKILSNVGRTPPKSHEQPSHQAGCPLHQRIGSESIE
jgi:hypothetical protein